LKSQRTSATVVYSEQRVEFDIPTVIGLCISCVLTTFIKDDDDDDDDDVLFIYLFIYLCIYLFAEFRMQHYNSKSKVHKTKYAYMVTKGQMCRHLHSTNKIKNASN